MDQNQQQNRSIQIPPDIRNYLESVMQDANMHVLDNEKKEAMLQELFERLDKFIAVKMVEQLSSDNLDQFMRLQEEKKPQSEIEKFLQDNVPNVKDIFTQAFIEFRDIYLNNVSAARAQEA